MSGDHNMSQHDNINKPWVGLTDTEVLEEEEFINYRYGKPINHSTAILMDFVRQVEIKLKGKNT